MDGRTEEATLSPAELPPHPSADAHDEAQIPEVEETSPLPEVADPEAPSQVQKHWQKVRTSFLEDPGESQHGEGEFSVGELGLAYSERIHEKHMEDPEGGNKQRVSIEDPDYDTSAETSIVLVNECAICRHLFNNYAKEDRLECKRHTDDAGAFRPPFAQYWCEKEMVEDREAPQSRPALCRFHALYKERHDFLVYILEQRRQNRRLTTAELQAMQKIDVGGGAHDAKYLKSVEAVVEEHFKIAREAVMRGLAAEARQLRSHWENTRDRQDQEIVDDLSEMQKRHQTELQEQRGKIRSTLGRKRLHYSSELLSSFENEKHLLEKRDWASACNEAMRATAVEKGARQQFQMEMKEEAKRREDWVRTLLERRKNSRVDRCARRRQMSAVERASDGERLYRRLEQTTQRLQRAHANEVRKVRAHFAEHCSRMSHIVERTARGSGTPQEPEHRRPLYATPVRVPFKTEEPPGGTSQKQKSADDKGSGDKLNMTRSLPGEFASKILAEEMRISMHRMLAAASRMRRKGSAPGGTLPAGAATISAARPPSANSRLRNPIEQRMVGQLRQRPSSAGELGRQPRTATDSHGAKGIYGTQWPQLREPSRCDFCGKRTRNPKLLPGSKTEEDGDIICVGCSWECVRLWNAKLSPPFLRDARADFIQDLCGQEALAAAEASSD